MTHTPATQLKTAPMNPAEEYPANQAGLAAADRDLYAARVHLRTEQDKSVQLDLYDRCAQLGYRIAEILNVVNGSSAGLPVRPTFTYTLVPKNQDDDKRCCIVCGSSTDGLLEVMHTAARIQASVCLAHDGRQVRDILATHARHQELQALAERYPVNSTALYAPESGTYRDVVVVQSGPAEDGTVEASSARHKGKPIRVPLDKLTPLPEQPPATEGEPLPWGSRVLCTSDARHGTVTGYGTERRMIIQWDGAVVPQPHHYTRDELTTPKFLVFPAVTHCSGCGHIVDDDEIEDSYTTCCNEGACSLCAAVNGVYRCGTEVPAADAA
ncbi:hypothetical protein [Streptomyces sp. S1D4-20]|uniref:hypothetical protein n=1 Tax=Streptomyces sp. S1D4-20 TaxID=2594462 RepID=UPI0011651111|nr:hypothetical protein [Streptomyces sp. S1D4-20]QDN54053.1 hypothetical protein FNV67_00290 [Streptomyces sp. S1D4-20]